MSKEQDEIVLGNYRWSRTEHGDWSVWKRTERGAEWVYDGLADAFQTRLVMEIVRLRETVAALANVDDARKR